MKEMLAGDLHSSSTNYKSPSKCRINTANWVLPGGNNHQPGEPSTWALVAAQDTLWGEVETTHLPFLPLLKTLQVIY